MHDTYADRMCLVMLLCTAMDSIYVLENPASSLMFEFHHVKDVIRRLKRVGVKVRGRAHTLPICAFPPF